MLTELLKLLGILTVLILCIITTAFAYKSGTDCQAFIENEEENTTVEAFSIMSWIIIGIAFIFLISIAIIGKSGWPDVAFERTRYKYPMLSRRTPFIFYCFIVVFSAIASITAMNQTSKCQSYDEDKKHVPAAIGFMTGVMFILLVLGFVYGMSNMKRGGTTPSAGFGRRRRR